MALDERMRPAEAARYLGLSESYLAKLRWRGGGPTYHKLSAKAVRYSRSDLDAWLDEKRCENTAQEVAQ